MLVFWARIIKHQGNEVYAGNKAHNGGLRLSFVT